MKWFARKKCPLYKQDFDFDKNNLNKSDTKENLLTINDSNEIVLGKNTKGNTSIKFRY